MPGAHMGGSIYTCGVPSALIPYLDYSVGISGITNEHGPFGASPFCRSGSRLVSNKPNANDDPFRLNHGNNFLH